MSCAKVQSANSMEFSANHVPLGACHATSAFSQNNCRNFLGNLRVHFFEIRFLNLDKSVNGFCVSLLNRLIQDRSDHGAAKESKNSLWTWILFKILLLSLQ